MVKKESKVTAPASNGAPSKREAVRQALAELGADAMPLRIQQFVKEKFNFDMTLSHISNCKSEITRRKGKGKSAASKQPTAAGTEGTSQPATAAKGNGEATSPAASSPAEGITKIEAVRQALKAKGKDATASQLQPWIKQTFNLEMSNEHITKYKGKILSQRKGGGKPGAKKATTAKAGGVGTPPVKESAPVTRGGSGSATSGIRLEDVQVTRELVGRVGAEQLRTLIALFEK